MSDVGTPFAETMQEEGEEEGIAEPTTEHRPRARQAHYTSPPEKEEEEGDNCDRFSHSQNKFWEENKMKERGEEVEGEREEVATWRGEPTVAAAAAGPGWLIHDHGGHDIPPA